MGQLATRNESRDLAIYWAIVGRAPSESATHNLINGRVYRWLMASRSKSESSSRSGATVGEPCARCGRQIDDEVPCLRANRRCIVCFCCYARDRLRHLARYALLARQVVSRDSELCDLAGPIAVLVASLLSTSAIDEPIKCSAQDLASASYTLRHLVAYRLTVCWWRGAFNVVRPVPVDGEVCWSAIVFGASRGLKTVSWGLADDRGWLRHSRDFESHGFTRVLRFIAEFVESNFTVYPFDVEKRQFDPRPVIR